MKVLATFCLCFVIYGLSLAEEEKSKKKEKIVGFYKCMACVGGILPMGKAPADAHTAYAKCKELKPETSKEYSKECKKQVIGDLENEDAWKHLCETPTDIGKIFDCMAKGKDEYYKTLTEEDITAWKKFKECAKGLKEQYCTQ